MTDQSFLETIDPEQVAGELFEFRASAVLVFPAGAVLEEHNGYWVAAADGKVLAQSDSYDGIFEEMYEKGIDPRQTLVRHIQENQRTLIV